MVGGKLNWVNPPLLTRLMHDFERIEHKVCAPALSGYPELVPPTKIAKTQVPTERVIISQPFDTVPTGIN